MGKQINFYMSDIVQERFSDYLEQNGFIFLDNNSKVICNPTSKDVFGMYLYKKNYGKIVMNQYNNGIMDSISSPVIQYSKTVTKEEEKQFYEEEYGYRNNIAMKVD